MPESYQSATEFLAKMDAGELDDNLVYEVQKLTDAQRLELVKLLMERDEASHSAVK